MSDTVAEFSVGTTVRTTNPNLDMREEWTERAWGQKRWGVEGVVVSEHNFHGPCFEVEHEDGTKATYHFTEIELQ
jgi:hypothetical protein